MATGKGRGVGWCCSHQSTPPKLYPRTERSSILPSSPDFLVFLVGSADKARCFADLRQDKEIFKNGRMRKSGRDVRKTTPYSSKCLVIVTSRIVPLILEVGSELCSFLTLGTDQLKGEPSALWWESHVLDHWTVHGRRAGRGQVVSPLGIKGQNH
ncbi:hypothetical protein RRG08_036186 [Elysia crispata]|uniref:Uncharacterized protein n=1 Tax=Elysia crispata TaxID=231223 RepID=A0AAE1CEM0_9GAST|nr:hypothetical protein RRG08_036186 [Elysia crispata]